MKTTSVSFSTVVLTDFWVHVGGVIAIAIGLLGDRYLGTDFGATANLMFILGGFAAMGLKLTNGTVEAVSAAAAQAVKDTAVQTAATLAAVPPPAGIMPLAAAPPPPAEAKAP